MFRFRRARPASRSWNAGKTLLQIVAFWGLFLVILPGWIVSYTGGPKGTERVVLVNIGAIALLVFGSVLGLWSAWSMVSIGEGTPLPLDAPRRLVTTGPYARIRNPMATAGLIQGLGVALWYQSLLLALFFLFGVTLWHLIVRPVEERDLADAFGPAYTAYRNEVPLWLPWRGRV